MRQNEDAILVRYLDVGESPGLLAVLADGMGGLAHGALASQAAIIAFVAEVERRGCSRPKETLRSGFVAAHSAVRDLAARAERRMGTTLIAALIGEQQTYVANVGDSRAYVVQPASATRLTADHSLAAEHARNGLLSPAEADRSPSRNLLVRSIGTEESPPEIDIFGPLELRREQRLLLCSDGLYSVVEDEAIARIAHLINSPQNAADELVKRANASGGPDNISVIVVGFGDRR